MKVFAIDFAYYDWDKLIYTIKWIPCNSKERAEEILIKRYGNVHIQDIREMRNYFY